MIIETTRLRLRRYRESDADDVHRYASDAEVCRFTDFGPNTWEETVAFMAKAANPGVDPLAYLAITLRGNDTVVGGTGALTPFGEEPDDRPHVREISWVLSKHLWGQGFVPEAVGALIEHLRLDSSLTRLEARCRPQNAASTRVMEKLGMKFEWLLQQDYKLRGEYVDSHLYSLDLAGRFAHSE